jgi:NTP pyrophosphatase (non-canonical NTP hydrolase)
MQFDEYQGAARATAFYPKLCEVPVYPVMGLCGEAGEVSEKAKKILRDKQGIMSAEDRDALIDELGDVLWYIANIAADIDCELSYLAQRNIVKLRARAAKGTLAGSGDSR